MAFQAFLTYKHFMDFGQENNQNIFAKIKNLFSKNNYATVKLIKIIDFFKEQQKFIIAIVCSAFLYGASIGMNLVILPLTFEDYGFSKTIIGLLMSAEIAATLFVAPLMPKLTRKHPVKTILITAVIIRNLSLAIIPLGSGLFYWLPIMLMFGLGGFTFFTIMQVWVNNHSVTEVRGMTIGILTAALSLGIAVGPVLLNVTKSIDSFYLSAMFGMLSFAPLSFITSTLPSYIHAKKIKLLAVIKQAPLPIISGAMVDFIFFSLSSFIVLYGVASGLDKEEAALLISAMLIGGIVLDIPLGIIADIVDRRKMIIISSFIILVCCQILPYIINNSIFAALLFAVWLGAIGAIYTCSLALLGDYFKDSNLIAANSAFSFIGCLGGLSGVACSGIAIDLMGPSGLTFAISIIVLLYLLFTGYLYYNSCYKEFNIEAK